MSTTIAPPTNRRSQGSHKSGSRRNDTHKIYGNPLPILFSDDEKPSRVTSLLGLLGLSRTQVLYPHCQGFFDAPTRSVWVTDTNDVTILWRRGFFGKGDLSRSEPSWLTRQVNLRKTGGKRLSLALRYSSNIYPNMSLVVFIHPKS
jgi:tRNA-splicing endonuclease subunit Sen2